MQQDREFQGKSLEEALERAAAGTGRQPGELKYELLEEGKRGFLGVGGRNVRIRLVDEPAPASPPAAGHASREQRSVPRAGSPKAQDAPVKSRGSRGPDEARPPADPDHDAVHEVAERILLEMGVDVEIHLRDRDEAIVLELIGPDSRLFLEDEGEAIEALQHLVNRILSRDEPLGPRVIVDCGGFRSRRDEETVERAKHGAATAIRTSRPVYIDGLNAYERRLIHVALAEDTKIRTYSTGDGAIKRLTIEPVGPRSGAPHKT